MMYMSEMIHFTCEVLYSCQTVLHLKLHLNDTVKNMASSVFGVPSLSTFTDL